MPIPRQTKGNPAITTSDDILEACVIADSSIETEEFDYNAIYHLAN